MTTTDRTARLAHDLDDVAVAHTLSGFFRAQRFNVGVAEVSAESGVAANRVAGAMARMWKSGDLKTMRTGMTVCGLFFARNQALVK